MTGRNPWAVLCVAEDAPYTEVQRAFRRRVKQTHPDGGGDAGEFATVVRAFEDMRHTLPRERHRDPVRPTPYDGWLRPYRPTRWWTEDVAPVSVMSPGPSSDGDPVPAAGSDFDGILGREMARAGVSPAYH